MKLPEGFCRRMEAALGKEAPSFFAAMELAPSRAFRYDPEKVTEEELRSSFGDSLGERIPFDPAAFRFEGEKIGNHPYHHGGALYVQEPCAMAPVAALGDGEYHRILDLCAAPGGKSLQAAARVLSPSGLLVSNEPEGKRRKVLLQNLERLGEKRCQVTGFDARRLPENWKESFDLVLCDAPCSGEGMMRKSQEAAEGWSLENIALCARRQKEILEEAARVLAPGGRLLYSTCTWAREENEEVVAHFLSRHKEFSLVSPAPSVCALSREGEGEVPFDRAFVRRFYPHVWNGEGQFLAILEKEKGSAVERNEKRKEKAKKKRDEREEILLSFFKENLVLLPGEELIFRDSDAYLVPQGGLCEKDTVSPGVLVGTVQKGRLVPHHRFFLAYHKDFIRKIFLSHEDSRAEAYLRGEEILIDAPKGYGVLYYGACPLGGVKISQGRGKNCYPKGLRKV